MTQQLIDERDLFVQAKISTKKTIAKKYDKHYHNLTMIGEEKQIICLIEKFTNVMEIIYFLSGMIIEMMHPWAEKALHNLWKSFMLTCFKHM